MSNYNELSWEGKRRRLEEAAKVALADGRVWATKGLAWEVAGQIGIPPSIAGRDLLKAAPDLAIARRSAETFRAYGRVNRRWEWYLEPPKERPPTFRCDLETAWRTVSIALIEKGEEDLATRVGMVLDARQQPDDLSDLLGE